MKEAKSDILNLSNSKNLSLPKSFQRIKKSKNLQQRNNKKSNSKQKKETTKKKLSPLYIINSQLQKHNSNPLIKNIMIINDIIDTKTNHFLAIFKDYLITDYIDEFLKRYFALSECEELIPKFYVYYKNYLKFFCRGFFIDFQANKIIQEYGEYQAELYYNKNYGMKDKKSKKNKNDENINCNSSKNISNNSNYNLNKLKIIFTESIKNSINRVENSKLIRNYIYKYNTNEISNILYNNKNETLTLNDDTKVYNNDNIITNENSLINLIDNMIHKKRKEKAKKNKNKNMKNNNDKNIVNIYKNLLNQSPIKSSRNINYIKNVQYNKTSRKVSSIKIFNKNIPIIVKKGKCNNISNELKDNAKTPIYIENPKTATKTNHSRNSKINNSNLFMKSNKTQKGHYRNTSKLISSRLGGNLITNKNANSKFSSFNTNLIIDNQNNKNKIKFNGLYSRNIDNYLLSTSSSRNLKNIFMYSYHSNKNLNNNNANINANNNKKTNNRIKHYQYINYKNKTQLKNNNSTNKHKQSYSLSNSNSIFNNFHININNNIMLLNNNNNNTHYNSNKNNLKSNSKSKKRIDDIKLNLNKQTKSRNIGIGFDLKKYKTEKNCINNIKNKKNICSYIRKYIYLVKTRSKSKDKICKNKEILVRNKSNLYNNHSCFKIKKIEDSDIMPSLKNFKKLNNSGKNLNLNKVQKINIIFDYKRK